MIRDSSLKVFYLPFQLAHHKIQLAEPVQDDVPENASAKIEMVPPRLTDS